MLTKRQVGLLGIGALVLFWVASFVLGALRPSYSHLANTLSELGAMGTPYAILWNVFGFMITGVSLAIVGGTVARSVIAAGSVRRALATAFLVLAGLAVAAQGIFPAEMVDGVADVTSPYTRGHFISSLVSGAAWAVGALMLAGPMKRNPDWRGLSVVGVVLVALTLLAALTLRGVFPDGLAQRTGNLIFMAWFWLVSLKLVAVGAGERRLSSNR